MATFEDKLSGSLARLERVTRTGRSVFAARELGRVHRDRLISAGYLQRIIGGWMLRVPPGSEPSDGTAWWAAYWSFCAAYCESRFDEVWHLSAEQSVLLHAEDTVVPSTLVVCARKGQNNHLDLLHGTALYDLREANPPPAEDLVVRDGLRLLTLDAALVRVPESFYVTHPLEAQLALRSIPDASGLLRRLLKAGQPVVAGRLAGALRHIGRVDLCEEIIATMRAAGHNPAERNPFVNPRLPAVHRRGAPSIASRLAGLVALGRASLSNLPMPAAGRVAAPNEYLEQLMNTYAEDAFHGLWLDGQVVTRDSIRAADAERPVKRGEARDVSVLVARGDLMAFRAVSRAIGAILAGAPAVEVLRDAHREWYREFMKPRVSAGLLPASALAGYREESMYLPGSRFVPPGPQLMRVALPVVFDLLESEPEPFIRAVLARWLIGYLNPYREGNERMSQFLMNALLAAGGWQWRTIEGTQQARYLDALERANLSYDLAPMAQLVKEGLHAAIRSEALGVPLSAPVDFALPEPAAEPDGAIAIEPEPESEAAAARATVIEPEPAQVSRNSSDPLPLQADPVAPTGTLVESAPQTAASRAYDESPPRDPTESQVVTPTEEAAAEPIPTTGKAKRAKRKAAYAPQPTQMGLFGE